MRTRLLLSLLLLASMHGPARGAVPVMPFDEVAPGMKGSGRTVFEGTRIETFDVEILGKLANVGPNQDLILARCSGGPLERTGVMAGMSGSPVTIDGRLVGAIAYSWGFSKEPIAGITPIEEMLAIAGLDQRSPGLRSGFALPPGDLPASLVSPERLETFLAEELPAVFRRPAGALPLSLPLSVSGLDARGVARLEPLLSDSGFLPLQTGAAGSSAGEPIPLRPGSAMGLQLVRGDLEMTATGTVTWMDGDRVLGFGHPLFGLGSLDVPLTGAVVQALLPSLMRSARIATPTIEIGSLRQDRSSGVLGLLDARPRMIPVRLQLADSSREERVYSFDVADDPLLSPLLLYVSLNGILASRERPVGAATIRLREGSVIKMAGGTDVELDNVFAGDRAFEFGTGISAYILYLLMNNVWAQPQIAGVNLILEYDDLPRSALIRGVWIDRYRVRAGETLTAAVTLLPFRGPEQVFDAEIKIPEGIPPGALTLQFGSAIAIAREDVDDEPLLPRDLDQLVRLINRLRRNDRIHIAGTRDDTGVLLRGARLPSLPPSAATLITRPKSKGNFVFVPRRTVLEESILTDFAVEGQARVEIEVVAP
jgi:hypothetical protein